MNLIENEKIYFLDTKKKKIIKRGLKLKKVLKSYKFKGWFEYFVTIIYILFFILKNCFIFKKIFISS